MEVIVPDASIILKWVLAGEDGVEEEKALEILHDWLAEKIQIILPPLWLYEVGNILGLKRPDQARELLEVLLDYRFEEAQITEKICGLALELMQELRVSFYDAIYHAIALNQKSIFVTADKRYFGKAVKKGQIKLLGSYSRAG